jgi:hypothetical protein
MAIMYEFLSLLNLTIMLLYVDSMYHKILYDKTINYKLVSKLLLNLQSMLLLDFFGTLQRMLKIH